MAYQDSIDDLYIRQFSHTVFELASQTMARTRGIVEIEPLNAEDMMFPRIGTVEVQDINEKFADIVPTDILWDNRRLAADRVGVAMYVDEWDAQKVLCDPQSILAKRAAEGLERHFDRTVIKTATATVLTGKNGTTPITAAVDGVEEVDATSGFDFDTLLEIDENFQGNEIGTEMPVKKYLLISEQEHAALMNDTKLTSRDYTNQFVIDQGYIKRALDFELIVYGSKVANPILKVAGGERSCLAIAAGGIKIGISKNWDVQRNPIKHKWYTEMVTAAGILGGVRMEALRVQEIKTTAA